MNPTLPATLALTVVFLSPIGNAQVQDLGASGVSRFFLSADGRAGVGQQLEPGGQQEIFRWTEAGGLETLSTPSGRPGAARAISADGKVVCGTAVGPETTKRAIRWDESGNAVDISVSGTVGTLPIAMSDDGQMIALTVNRADGTERAAIWTPGFGTIEINSVFGSDESEIVLLSGDGSTAVVRTTSAGAASDFFLWSIASGPIPFFTPTGFNFWPTGISTEGDVITGLATTPSGEDLFRWTAASGFEFAPTGIDAPALGVRVSSDGSTAYGVIYEIVGFTTPSFFSWTSPGTPLVMNAPMSVVLADSTPSGSTLVGTLSESIDTPGRAIQWSAGTGFVELDSFHGSSRATSISSDGSRIGGTYSIDGEDRAVIWQVDGSLGTSYCGPAIPNSTGAPAAMALGGSNVRGFDSLILEASGLPLQATGFFLGSDAPGFVAMPAGSSGNLCLGGSIGRFVGPGQILGTGDTGTMSLEIDPGLMPGPNGPVIPSAGQSWYFQAWFRDANPLPTSNFTDGVTVPIY